MTAGTVDAPQRSSLAAETMVFAGWLLLHWRRQSSVVIQSLLFPSFLLITYKLLVGKSILRITGTDSLYGLVPMCAVAGAMYGALAAGRSIPSSTASACSVECGYFPCTGPAP